MDGSRRLRLMAVGLVLLAASVSCYAQQKPVTAVIPFQALGVSAAEAQGLAVLFEAALQKTGRFTVIEQTRMESVLKAQETSLADCTDEACAVEIGKLLAAEQIVLGTAGKIGQRYYLAVRLIDVAKGTNLATENEQKPSLDEIVDTLVGLAGRLAGLNDAQPPKATVATSPSPASVAAPKPTNSLIEMVLVEGGTFRMGDVSNGPSVTLSSYLVGRTEVTQTDWQRVMGTNPSKFKGGNLPVERVNWYDAVAFCNKLSQIDGLTPCYNISGNDVSCDSTKSGYRLLTEAEWEYAARGGKQTRGTAYSGGSDVGSVAWYSSNAGSTTHPVGTKAANELGVYDMSGSVGEWCWDWYSNLGGGSLRDPTGPTSGSGRVLRGGSWGSNDYYAEVAFRNFSSPGNRYDSHGFRVARRPR